MDKTLTLKPNAKAEDYREAVREMFAEMDVLDARIAQNQAETERLRAETRTILRELKTTLRGPMYVAADI